LEINKEVWRAYLINWRLRRKKEREKRHYLNLGGGPYKRRKNILELGNTSRDCFGSVIKKGEGKKNGTREEEKSVVSMLRRGNPPPGRTQGERPK